MKAPLIRKSLGMLALAAIGLAANSAHADWNRGHRDHMHHYLAYQQSQSFSRQIDARQERQIDRIRDGMREGSLTRAEFRELMREQHAIRAMEQHFRADGVIDAREFERLERALDIASRNIKLENRDRQERYAYHPSPWRD